MRLTFRQRPVPILIVFLVLMGMLPVVGDLAAGKGRSRVATGDGTMSVHGGCAEHVGYGLQGSCGDSFCPAGHCPAPSFLPSPDMPTHTVRPSGDYALSTDAYASHLSAPSIPPPIGGPSS